MFEMFLLIVFPYICLALMVVGIVVNMRSSKLRISAPATGFFESKKLFWGSVPWHYGILMVLAGHLIGLLFPGLVKSVSAGYGMLVALEVTALAFGLSALFGIWVLLVRRITEKSIITNSRPIEVIVLVVLALQVLLGVATAISYRWGISWYASNMSGYLWSIFTFRPSLAHASGLPGVLVAHIVGGFTLLALLPYTKLMHLLYVPVQYFNRKPQVVIYYGSKK